MSTDIAKPFRWWKFQLLAKETLVESRECLKFGNNDFIRRGHILNTMPDPLLDFENDDFIRRGPFLNAMPDPLLDVYQNYPTARELWKALEERFNKPDIAYAVGRLSRHTSSPSKEHWDAVNRVFKYLKKTTDYGLEYNGDPSVLEVFWGSKKQSCLTDSSMAAEFVALESCCKEAEWL
ncbi:hypothetical protein Tco_1366536 [Tanacetum coccineum]